eukprot:1655865-Pyramimonas_sp.AAC.1
MLLCECANLNAGIAREVREERWPHRTVFQLHKYVLPAGDSASITLIGINAGFGRSAVRGHYERLECVSRAVPPPPVPPTLPTHSEASQTQRGLPDASDVRAGNISRAGKKVLVAAWKTGECSDGAKCGGRCAGDGVNVADAD